LPHAGTLSCSILTPLCCVTRSDLGTFTDCIVLMRGVKMMFGSGLFALAVAMPPGVERAARLSLHAIGEDAQVSPRCTRGVCHSEFLGLLQRSVGSSRGKRTASPARGRNTPSSHSAIAANRALQLDAGASSASTSYSLAASHTELKVGADPAYRGPQKLRQVSVAAILVILLIGGGLAIRHRCVGGTPAAETALSGSIETTDAAVRRRWPLIMASVYVQFIAGSIYSMGAWQDSLRDALGISMQEVSTIGSATFLGAVASYLGGLAFRRLGARYCVAIGSVLCSTGYMLLLVAVVSGESASRDVRIALAAVGSLCAGYSSVCLLDNIVCMVCSLSFPYDRASVVGYLKAMVGASGGVWAVLWKALFQQADGSGLPQFLAAMAALSLGVSLLALIPMETLPESRARSRFGADEKRRYGALSLAMIALPLFNVVVSYLLSNGTIQPTPALGFADIAILVVPLLVLLLPPPTFNNEDAPGNQSASPASLSTPLADSASSSIPFSVAIGGLDFWLLVFVQFTIFGSGVATNQNLALIFESLGSPEFAGLAVALFAMTSAASRMVVGVLSDQYASKFTRFNWVQVVTVCGTCSQALISTGNLMACAIGVVLAGFSFGAFYTVIVPIVNEIYGPEAFGEILATQLASQAFASLLICKLLLSFFYSRAAADAAVCTGVDCFRLSFIVLAVMCGASFLAACSLERRRRAAMPSDPAKG